MAGIRGIIAGVVVIGVIAIVVIIVFAAKQKNPKKSDRKNEIAEYANKNGYVYHGDMLLEKLKVEKRIRKEINPEDLNRKRRAKLEQAFKIYKILFPSEEIRFDSESGYDRNVWSLIEIPRKEGKQYLFDWGIVFRTSNGNVSRSDFTKSVYRSDALNGLPDFSVIPAEDIKKALQNESPEVRTELEKRISFLPGRNESTAVYAVAGEEISSITENVNEELSGYLYAHPGYRASFSAGTLTCECVVEHSGGMGIHSYIAEVSDFDRLIDFTYNVGRMLGMGN
jgi:hypothetical protein